MTTSERFNLIKKIGITPSMKRGRKVRQAQNADAIPADAIVTRKYDRPFIAPNGELIQRSHTVKAWMQDGIIYYANLTKLTMTTKIQEIQEQADIVSTLKDFENAEPFQYKVWGKVMAAMIQFHGFYTMIYKGKKYFITA